ncbi:MAG: hypothetical protein AAF892_08010 [Cyanobacteria bacterium P01_D01_bin.71]
MNSTMGRVALLTLPAGFRITRKEVDVPTAIQEIHSRILSTLSPTKRLQSLTLILNSLVQENIAVDDSDTWTEQEQLCLTNFFLQYAATAFPEDNEIAE